MVEQTSEMAFSRGIPQATAEAEGASPVRSPLGTRIAAKRQTGASNPTPEKCHSDDDAYRFLRLSGPIEHDNIVNGYGLRAVIWTQGCKKHCKGCQNPETWDLFSGLEVEVDSIKDSLKKLKGQTGLTFCGGEPFLHPEACKEIADWARNELGWNIWSFSGYTYEEIQQEGGAKWEFLKSLDALIDGPFVLAERDLTLKFRGSRNQRLLHLEPGTAKILKIE